MKVFGFVLLMIFLSVSSLFAGTAVKIHVQWESKGLNIHPALYEVKDEAKLSETRNVNNIGKAPLVAMIQNGTVALVPGQTKWLAMVIENETNQPIYFFSAPHGATPSEATLGFKLKCLCTGQAYTVKPHETWYRVMAIHLDKAFSGEELSLTHSLVGIDAARARAFSKNPDHPEF